MVSLCDLPTDTLLRILQRVIVDDTETQTMVRASCATLRDAVREWVRTTPMRLCQVVRLLPAVFTPPVLVVTTAAGGVFHLECRMRPDVAAAVASTMDFRSALRDCLFVRCRNEWRASMRKLLHTLATARVPLARITRWRFDCVLPVYGHCESTDAFLRTAASVGGETFRARVVRHLQGLSSLERVHLRLCAPHVHFNRETGHLDYSRGPQNIGQTAFLRMVTQALPSWQHLTHLTLTDLSFAHRRDGIDLVRMLALALIQDTVVVAAVHEAWNNWVNPMEAYSRPSQLQLLHLEGVWLGSQDGNDNLLFWLLVGAFPVRRLVLTQTNIIWPIVDTIFTQHFGTNAKKEAVELDLRGNRAGFGDQLRTVRLCFEHPAVDVRLPEA